jgi:MFS family permease
LEAGAATLPLTLLMLALAERFGRLGERRGPRPLMVTGQLLAAAGLLLLSFLAPGDDYLRDVLPGVLLFGTGLAFTVAPLTNTAVSAVGDDQAGLASGVNNAAARLAGLLGVAAIGLVFAVAFRGDLPASTPTGQSGALEQARQSPTSALDLSLEPPARAVVEDASVQGYRLGMWTGAGLAAVGALIALAGIGTAPSRGDRTECAPAQSRKPAEAETP